MLNSFQHLKKYDTLKQVQGDRYCFNNIYTKYAFTLAEVLITLVIIGVIAAITVPTLITKYQKEQTVTQLKRAYSILSQAIYKSVSENGPIEGWIFSSESQVYNDYLKKYLVDSKPYHSGTNFGRYPFSYLNGNSGYFNYSTLFSLSDGTIYSLAVTDSGHNKTILIHVDLNGLRKPNKMGKDIFSFTVSSYSRYESKSILNKLRPYGGSSTRESLLNDTNDNNCNKNKNGQFCSAVIMKDGWQIKDDYPW